MTSPTVPTKDDDGGSGGGGGPTKKFVGTHCNRIASIAFTIVAFFIIGQNEIDEDPAHLETIVKRPIKRLDRSNQPKLDITLTFRHRRTDRMGSRIQLPLSAWLVARYHGWKFCTPPDPMAEALSFPICNDTFPNPEADQFDYHDDNITKPGVYYINSNQNTLWGTIAAYDRKMYPCMMMEQQKNGGI